MSVRSQTTSAKKLILAWMKNF